MKFLDRLAFNRLVKILSDFILKLTKLLFPKTLDNTPTPTPSPKKPKILPWRNKSV
jgi:hypothetical protein